uniref:Uncharacterized protein n=1 Tax=Panagrolaimus sp. ES5 TaxID=591445 RepID=A0AC34GSH5_9BILA
MNLQKEFFDRCCPSFQKVINELRKKIADIQSQSGVNYDLRNEKEQLACYEFYTAYYAPLEFLVNYYRMYETDLKWFEERGLLELYLYAHEEFQDTWRKREQDSSKFIFAWKYEFFYFWDKLQMGDIFTDERDLSYPNSLLDQFFYFYERHTTRPVSKQLVQKYEEMKALYTKIQAAEDDVQKWFNLLLEVGIDEFVYQVVEHRILGNLFDVKLWKIYFQHLKKTNPKKMLLCYSKYCRFFLDDAEMKAEYKVELEKFDGHVLLPWTNLFDFEEAAIAKTVLNDSNEKLAHIAVAPSDLEEFIQNVENLNVQNLVTVCHEDQPRSMKEICIGFYIKDICCPVFSFKKPFIDYIRENASPIVLQKFFKSSKWFFAKQPTPICYSMDWRDRWNVAKAGPTYVNEKLVFNLRPARCGSNTGDALANMKFNKKIYQFVMTGIKGEPFDPIEFKKFHDANTSEDSYSFMSFRDDFAEEFVQKCRSIIGHFID